MRAEDIVVLVCVILVLSIVMTSDASANIFDWFRSITGRVTSPVTVNITVTSGTAPLIYYINNATFSPVSLQSGPILTNVSINFSVNSSQGYTNINFSTAFVNISKSGQSTRLNSSCALISGSGNYANVTCTVNMLWYDGSGSWIVSANISDINGNTATNATTTLSVSGNTAFSASSNISFSSITPGSSNTTSSTALEMNNTGNYAFTIGNIAMNATILKGETTSSQALYTNNFSMAVYSGTPSCNSTATSLNTSVYSTLNIANLTTGNYTVNDGVTGQELIYTCLRQAGSELTAQKYSTGGAGAWTLQAQ